MALTRTEALRQVVELLEEISAKLNRSHTVTVGQRTVIIDITGIITELKLILLELEAQSNTLTDIEGKDFATETTLALLEGKDFATQTTLVALLTAFNNEDFAQESGGNLDALASIDFFLSGDTTDGGDLLNELQSIDQNWNLLSVNNITLAAILTAVLNNATSGRQDDAQDSFDLMVTDLDDMANRMNLLLRQFEQQWSRTYTCTVAGTLILTFSVPVNDTFRDTSFSFGAAVSAGRVLTIVRARSGGSIIDIWEGGHTIPTLALKPVPNQGASGISKLPAQNGFMANATETLVVTIAGLTAVLPDIITVRLIADKRNITNMATPVVSGTGTFTAGAEIRTVVTRF